MIKYIQAILLLIGISTLLPVPVMAEPLDFSQNLIPYQESLVPEGQSVNSVFLVGKDGVIAGDVKDEVVIINSNLTITSTVKIADHIFVIGGQIYQEPGAQVGKGIIHISTSSDMVNALLLGVFAFFGLEIIKLILSFSLILGAVIVVLLILGVAKSSAEALKSGFLKSATLGTLGLLCCGLLMGAFTVSIIGIPLAVLLLLLVFISLVIGFAGMGLVINDLFKENRIFPSSSIILSVGIGSLLLVSFLNLPVLGLVWGIILAILAFGSIIQVVFNNFMRWNKTVK